MVRLGVIVGSTRPQSVGAQVGRWVRRVAADVPDLEVDLVDLAGTLPFLDEPVDASSSSGYVHPHTRAWSERVLAMDAVLLVTPEYNSSYSGVVKNALDFLYVEWRRKPVGFVGYGMTSAGTRAVAALAPVVAALGMVPAGAVFLPLRQRMTGDLLTPSESDDAGLSALVAELTGLAALLHPAMT